MSDKQLPVADASRRLRDVPGYPRRPGRPRKQPENGHASGQADNAAAQPRRVVDENRHGESAGVRQTPSHAPTVALGLPSGAVVTVAPRLLSLRDAGLYLGGISETTVREYLKTGLLTPVRLPAPPRFRHGVQAPPGKHLGRVVVAREELDAIVEQARGRP